MTNKEIAEKVGCNPTYVSQILRGSLPSTKMTRTSNVGATTTAAKRRTAVTSPTTGALLAAYHEMECIVKRVGTCSAKTMLEDISNGTT